MAKYGKSISFRDFVRYVKRYLDHTATLFNEEVSNKGNVIEVLNSSSVSSPKIFDNSPTSEHHMDVQSAETIHTDIAFHDDDANRGVIFVNLRLPHSLLFKFEGHISQVRKDHLYVHLKDSTRRDVLVQRKNLDDSYRGRELHTGDDVTLLCAAHNEGAVLKILKYRVKRKRPLIAGKHPKNINLTTVNTKQASSLAMQPHSRRHFSQCLP